MTKEQLAEKLNGREYRNEITAEEEKAAKEAGLVVVFAYEDDSAMFRGAMYYSIPCFNGGKLHFNKSGSNFEPHQPNLIEAVFSSDSQPWWTYKTDIPHATFDIMEDGDHYCRGIVLSVTDLK